MGDQINPAFTATVCQPSSKPEAVLSISRVLFVNQHSFFLSMVLWVSTDGEEPDLETAHLHPGQICEQHKPWPNKTSPLGTETSLSAGQEAQASAKWKNNRQRVEGWNSSLVCQQRAAGERTCQGLCSDPLPPLSPRLPSITARSLWLPFSLSPFCFPVFLYLFLLTLWYDSL